jgi:hypothetical protein
MTCLRSSNGARNWAGSFWTGGCEMECYGGALGLGSETMTPKNRVRENSLGRVCGGAGGQPPALSEAEDGALTVFGPGATMGF